MIRLTTQVALVASLASLAKGSPITDGLKNTIHSINITKSYTEMAMTDFIEREKIRRESFATSAAVAGSVPATNADVSYYVSVTVGNQPFSRMIVDTGSANTWVGASTRYAGSGCSATFQVSYGSGSVSGKECTGSVSVGSLTVPAQSFGAASSASGFDGVDGIFGVGPTDLTSGTVSGTNTVPTFLDNAYSQGSISTEVLGVYFKPETGSDTADQNGELTLGGVDTSKYTGPLTYFPKSIVSPFSYYWGINIVSIMYGITTISSSASAIVDTGTTLIYIPTPAYQAFLKASGSSTDPTTGLSSWTTRPTGTISFMIRNSAFPLSPAQYLIPAAQYGPFGLPSGKFYSWISDGGASGVNFIIGQKFLENYYSVYDTTNSRIGFATRA